MDKIIYVAYTHNKEYLGGGEYVLKELIENLLDTKEQILITNNIRLYEIFLDSIQVRLIDSKLDSILENRALLAKKGGQEVKVISNGVQSLSTTFLLTFLKFGVEKVHVEHLWTKEFFLPSSKIREFVIKLMMFCLLRFMSKIIVVSTGVYRFVNESMRIHARKIHVCHNGIREIPHVKESYKNSLPFKLVTIGSFNYIKNYKDLFYVINLLLYKYSMPIKLEIIGGGVKQKKWIEYARKRDLLDKVIFHGRVLNDKISSYLESSDLYLQTSKSESFGISIGEAMLTGLPVVAYNVGGIPDLVRDKKEGYLIDPYNYEDFAYKTKILLENEDLRKQMGKSARRRIKKNFTTEKMINNYINILYEDK